MFRRILGTVGLTVVAGVAVFNGLVLAETEAFPDVSVNHENHMAIEYLHGMEILKGDDRTGTFRPASNLNRAEFATVLARVAGATPNIDDYSDCFPDVTDDWYAPFVCWAKDEGYVKGFAAGEMAGQYGPEQPLLNAELIVVLSRIADWPVEPHGEWYQPAMLYAKEKGILDAEFDEDITRGVMAETIFRAEVVQSSEDDATYDEAEGKAFIEAEGKVNLAEAEQPEPEETPEVPKINVDVKAETIEATSVRPDETDVELLKFSLSNNDTEEKAEFIALKLTVGENTNPDSIVRLSLEDADTEDVLAELDTKSVYDGDNIMFVMSDFTGFLSPESKSHFVVKADLDVEKSSKIQIMIEEADDVIFGNGMARGEFPMMGGEYSVELSNILGTNADYFPACASWDAELNLPYSSGGDGAKAEVAGEDIGSVERPDAGHVIDPIDQGNEGICMAAATYSSLRWFEKDLGLAEDLVKDGKEGLDDLVASLYGDDIETADEQLAELERKLESEHPQCVEVEYDTQAGLNVACSELKEYKDDGCDIPLVFHCTKIDPETGEELEGDDAESWGHAVDLVDVKVDSNDDDMCSITYANSWKDSANPRPDVDGLGSGRYEEAEYNDDTEDFDIQAPWGDNYKCELYAAAYICIDENECGE